MKCYNIFIGVLKPKKNNGELIFMKNLKYIVAILVAAIIAASFSGCTEKKETTGQENEVVYYDDENSYVNPEINRQEALKNAVAVDGEIGTEAKVNESTIKADKIVSIGEVQDLYGENKEGIAIKFEAVNNSEDHLQLTALGNIEILVDGNLTESSDMMVAGVAGKIIEDYEVFGKTVKTGEMASGYVAFAVKPGWKEMIISFKPFIKYGNYDSVIYRIAPDMVESVE